MLAERGNKQIYKWINNKFPDEDKDSAENKTPKQMKSNWKSVLPVMVQEDHSEDVPLDRSQGPGAWWEEAGNERIWERAS